MSSEKHLQMEKRKHSEVDAERRPAEGPSSSGVQEVTSSRVRCEAEQPKKQKKKKHDDDDDKEPVLIHGLSVQRYREIYQSVLQPSVLATLASATPADYVCQALELKRRLWTALSRPRLQETVGEDGRVEVTEIFDLT